MATLDKITLKSPATVANIGPGFDVLGLAIDGLCEKLEARLIEGSSKIKAISGIDHEMVPLNSKKNTATFAADYYLSQKGIKQGLEISIERAFPISGGLGSSSVSSLSGAMAAAILTGNENDTSGILEAALHGEALVSGYHLDNVAPCYYGGITLVLSTNPIEVVSIKPPENLWISVVTPNMKLETKLAREVLPHSLKQAEWVAEMAKTAALVSAFKDNDLDLLAKVFRKSSYAETYRGPLISRFEEAKTRALNAGAIGVSISGAGPTTFAFCESKEMAIKTADIIKETYGDISFSHIGTISAKGTRLA